MPKGAYCDWCKKWIDIPKEREMFFDRETLSDEEMLKLMEHYTDIKLNNDIYLLTNEDIEHYQKIIVVLVETDVLMKKIDENF